MEQYFSNHRADTKTNRFFGFQPPKNDMIDFVMMTRIQGLVFAVLASALVACQPATLLAGTNPTEAGSDRLVLQETESGKAQESEEDQETKSDSKDSQPKSSASSEKEKQSETPSVGRKGTIKVVVLPFPGIKAKPIDPKDDLVVRIANEWSDAAGGRYELIYFGLEKGDYDLADYLVVPEGTDRSKLPSIPVTVTSIVPEGVFLLDDLETKKLPLVGGYWILHFAAYALWFVGLVLILLWGWKPRKKAAAEANRRPPTWAEKLRPLFVAAQKGDMNPEQQAELERLLITFWRDKLDLSGIPANQAMLKLADDPNAGPSVKKIEQWIHSPADRRPDEDIDALLNPYQQMVQTGEFPEAQEVGAK